MTKPHTHRILPFVIRHSSFVILNRFTQLLHRLCLALLLAALGLVWVRAWLPQPPLGGARWPEGLLVLLATAGTLAAQARQLPAQNVALSSAVIVSLAALAQAIGVWTGTPLGPFAGTFQPGGLAIEWMFWASVLCLLALLTARGVARLLLRPRQGSANYGLAVLGLTVLLALVFDLALEPFVTSLPAPGSQRLPGRLDFGWYGTPWLVFPARAGAALLMLLCATTSLINKRPGTTPPDCHPLAVWVLANLLFATGALACRFWSAAALDLLSALIAPLLALLVSRNE